MREFSIDGFVSHLARIQAELPVVEHRALEIACRHIEGTAKGYIGSTHGWWPALKPSTIAAKANGNTPLLETGDMLNSIEHTVRGKEGHVGSNDMKAVWQELGTSRGIPPRSFLGHAAQAEGGKVAKMIGREFYTVLATGNITWQAGALASGMLRTLGAPTTFSQAPAIHGGSHGKLP